MNIYSTLLLVVFLLFLSCNNKQDYQSIKSPLIVSQKKKHFKKETLQNWHFKDIELDTIPGISLNRTFDSLLVNLKPKEKIIVAVIDTEIDINHTDLKQRIWTNPNEVLNNNLDDDKNGYVDDVNGWNFIGNLKGGNNKYVNFELTRLLKRWGPYFENKIIEELPVKDSILYLHYKKVKKRYNERLDYFLAQKANYDLLHSMYFDAKKNLSKFFVNKPFNIKTLDSLRAAKIKDINNDDLLILIELFQNNIDDAYVLREKKHATDMVDKLLGLNYNDREIQGSRLKLVCELVL